MRTFSTSDLSLLTGASAALAEKISDKSAVIGIIGLGYVGMPLALEFAKKGFHVVGVDVSLHRVNMLNRGENFIEDLKDEEVAAVVASGHLVGTNEYKDLVPADVVYICVPTPFDPNKDPDLSYIISAGENLSHAMTPGKLVILKSTTFPGTTENYLIPLLDKSGLSAGRDYFAAFSPERVDPGNKQFHTGNTPIVAGGIDFESTLLAGWINNQIVDQVYLVDNPKIAELEKLLENIFRSVNIALVNELALLCERIGGINVWEVAEAAGTKPFGFLKFLPGPGVGGHCIPIDPYYLSWLAREYDFETRFITLAANVNESMPYHVVHLVLRQIAHQPITISQSRVLVLGASFKKNVKDLRHSPSEAIINLLNKEGIGQVDYSDPWAPEYIVGGKTYYSVDLTPEALAGYHCVVLITDHDDFDLEFILRHVPCLIDTRNATKGIYENREKIVLLGFSPEKPKLVFEH